MSCLARVWRAHRGKPAEFRNAATGVRNASWSFVRKPKRSKAKRLGIVPRALLGAAIAGGASGVVVPACSSDSGTIDGPQFAVDANPDGPEFQVAAPDAAIDRLSGVEFAVDANPPPD